MHTTTQWMYIATTGVINCIIAQPVAAYGVNNSDCSQAKNRVEYRICTRNTSHNRTDFDRAIQSAHTTTAAIVQDPAATVRHTFRAENDVDYKAKLDECARLKYKMSVVQNTMKVAEAKALMKCYHDIFENREQSLQQVRIQFHEHQLSIVDAKKDSPQFPNDASLEQSATIIDSRRKARANYRIWLRDIYNPQ